MIVDAFMYFNEQDVAEIRFNELDSIVDEFVVIVGDITFSGKPNDNRIVVPEKFRHKVRIVHTALPREDTAWDRENHLRAILVEFLKYAYNESDTVIFTDVDEIPYVEDVKLAAQFGSPISMNLDHYNYNFTYLKPHWECGIICRLGELTPGMRNRRSGSFVARGWHLSYFGDAEQIQQKIQAYSHTEFDKPLYTDLDNIQRRVDNKLDIIDRENVQIGARFPLPEYVTNNPERFEKYL